jgi:hypothetical protein
VEERRSPEVGYRIAARFEEQDDILAIGEPDSPEARAHAPAQPPDEQQPFRQRFRDVVESGPWCQDNPTLSPIGLMIEAGWNPPGIPYLTTWIRRQGFSEHRDLRPGFQRSPASATIGRHKDNTSETYGRVANCSGCFGLDAFALIDGPAAGGSGEPLLSPLRFYRSRLSIVPFSLAALDKLVHYSNAGSAQGNRDQRLN